MQCLNSALNITSPLCQVNDKPAEQYLLPSPGTSEGWKWDRSRWGTGGKVLDVVEALNKVRPPHFPKLLIAYTNVNLARK